MRVYRNDSFFFRVISYHEYTSTVACRERAAIQFAFFSVPEEPRDCGRNEHYDGGDEIHFRIAEMLGDAAVYD